LSEISGTASILDPDQYPGAEEQFRLPISQTYEALLGAARGFATAIGPVKAAFVERGLPADFDELLAQQVATFEAATNRIWDGRQTQMGGTARLETLWRRGMAAMKELDKILTNRLRTSSPELLTVWKAAKRQERIPQKKKDAPTASPASLSAAEPVLSTISIIGKDETLSVSIPG
jgi:hypothetical protein